MKKTIPIELLISSIILLLLSAGCNSTATNGNGPQMALSFVVKNAGQPSQSKQGAATQSNNVTITEAKLLIREVKFENDLEDDGMADDSLEFEAGPFVVVLNLDGTLTTVAVNEVPAGQFNEIKFDIHKPEDDETPPDSDFKIGTSGDKRFSVIICGTFNGQRFLYRSHENIKQEIGLATPLNIDENTQNLNVTLTVNTSQWFIDEDGNQLNPTNENDRNAIDKSIKRSFERAFEDSNKDGEKD